LQGIEEHRARIGAGLLSDHVGSGALAQISSCSIAAARNVSAAHKSTDRPSAL